jgi:3-hydroxybutyryl-CoA dehydrogenase
MIQESEGTLMTGKEIKRVAVIGAGLMGFGVATEFARFGYDVTMFNTRKETSQRSMGWAKEVLDLMVETELITKRNADDAYKRLHPTTDLQEAAKNADFVHESVSEDLNLKQAVFAKLDQICPPDVILATNTSGLRVSDIASATTHPERVLATHYFQPPHFIPLVEVVPTPKTDPALIEKAIKLMRSLRKKVVFIPIELPGFIGNRIQGSIAREVQTFIDRGNATPEMIDDVIQFGFGRRMAYTAYFKQVDVRGLDFSYNAAKARGGQAWKPIAEHVERGELGIESGKGFYDWSGDKGKNFLHHYSTELIRLMKQDMENGLI